MQGGSAALDEFYHLTSADVTRLANTSGTNTGNQVVPANEAGTANNFLTAYNSSTGAWTKARPTWGNIDKTTSSIADIATKDHDLLAGLLDDDHTQYALLAGRSGGQTLKGGTAASNNLTLQSTNHATKGKIVFGTSAYDEVNNRLGIATASPAYALEVAGDLSVGLAAATTAQIKVLGGAAGNPLVTLSRTSGITASFSWSLASGGLCINDDVSNDVTFSTSGVEGYNVVYAGQYKAGATLGTASMFSGETYNTGVGADVDAPNLYIRGCLGTGAGAAGSIFFNTGTVGTSGTTTHTSATRMTLTAQGNLGLGTSTFGTSAVSVLGIKNGTVPSTSPVDMIQIFSVDLSAGNATLGLRTETAVATETVTSDRTLSVKINGTTYKICLKA